MAVIFEHCYPIGSIYITESDLNPNTLVVGGSNSTWEKIQGKFIRGTDDSVTAGSTGGSNNRTLSIAIYHHTIIVDPQTALAHILTKFRIERTLTLVLVVVDNGQLIQEQLKSMAGVLKAQEITHIQSQLEILAAVLHSITNQRTLL